EPLDLEPAAVLSGMRVGAAVSAPAAPLLAGLPFLLLPLPLLLRVVQYDPSAAHLDAQALEVVVGQQHERPHADVLVDKERNVLGQLERVEQLDHALLVVHAQIALLVQLLLGAALEPRRGARQAPAAL